VRKTQIHRQGTKNTEKTTAHHPRGEVTEKRPEGIPLGVFSSFVVKGFFRVPLCLGGETELSGRDP
jgi:hypothetical protein